MTSDDFQFLMAAIGFGFGSLFWPFFFWLALKAK